ncbi:FAD-binding oxidoreductase [Algoriphagus sp. C2-6-M1]|uniref:FAD-binding oxidoreductase n=1 Tax=Algoriphagus persicinus TaxID=3108754 RepID=UPI002B3E02DF|nr:FAD-binding oxidoreductase [Algoriphagus sp. C2-6-M1]MEB2779737.1 FAD-binding oxidoreductase [Algoriphagus sp. C2-6-M1]
MKQYTNFIYTMTHILKILDIQAVTHDVKQYKLEKPKGYFFIPGQATEVAINKENWESEFRPFTFTSLPEEPHLEFVIKSYPDHDGVTDQLNKLNVGDELILNDSWGAIQYKGKGVFIAGGAGITPFIGIFRALEAKNKLTGNTLIFANKTAEDVILESYFRKALGNNFISILAEEEMGGHQHGMIDKDFIKAHVKEYNQEFYVCGPDLMVKEISKILKDLGANPEAITFEK